MFEKNNPETLNSSSLLNPITPHFAEMLMQAATEKQFFIESIYYQGLNQPTQKILTDQMKDLVIHPIKECINNDKQASPTIHKLLPTLYEWQKNKAPDLTYEEFKEVLSREKNLDNESKTIFLQQYILRVVERYYQSVVLPEKYQDPKSEEIESVARYPVNQENLKKIRYLVDRMGEYGVDRIIKHYQIIQEINRSSSPKEIDIINNSILADINQLNKDKLDELSKELLNILENKKESLQQKAKDQDKERATFTEEDLSKKLDDQFQTGFEYLISLIPEKDRHLLDRLPYFILKLAMALRKIMPVANTEVLSQIWWQLRLGGGRSQDLINHVEKEWPEFIKKQRLERYANHLFDNFLGSEASSFEFQNIISIDNSVTPNDIIFQIIKNLIRNHIPKNQNMIRLTLLNHDNRLLKISIPYQEGLSDEEIEKRIKQSIQLNHQWTDLTLDEEKKAELSYLGHNARKRKQNKNYKAIYQNFGKDPKTNQDYNGDYLIQIGSHYENSRDPRSLFTVDSHQAAIQIKFVEAGKVILTTRYNHQYFDGLPAQKHTDSLISEISDIKKISSLINIIPKDQNSQENFLKNLLKEPKILDLPLIEARADYDDDYRYPSISLSETDYFSSTDLRCLTIAIANGIEYYQQLVSGKKTGSYFIRNPNADNIQPVIVAPKTLKEKDISQWTRKYREAVERAKKGIGDVALFASIAGTKEVPLSYAGKFLNPNLIKMLTHSQGMISPILGYANFTTAFSDVYRPVKIDLVNPIPSMGIIGMGIDKNGISHYTVRLLPSQGQKKFKEAVEQLFVPNISNKEKIEVLKKFTKIIQAWDKLLCGQGPENQITLEEYANTRDKIVNNLIRQKLIVLPEGITIQAYLNKALQEAAEEVFDEKKITKAREEILKLLKIN